MKKQWKWGSSLVTFLIFFCLLSFVVSCFGMLFVSTLQEEYSLVLDNEHMEHLGKMGFLNVLLMSIAAAAFDRYRRGATVDQPVKRILEATRRITNGDFTAQIESMGKFQDHYGFDAIISNLNQMTRELGSIETLRTDFVANVSHELKTPLAVISNYATILQSPNLTEAERMEYARAIHHASRNLADLVTNILKLNKLENQQIFPDRTEFDLAEQLCQCILNFEDIWEKKNIELDVNIPETFPIKSDAELLGLVWNNLLSNAMKFTPEGGKVSISLREENGIAVVSVGDTGCGMTAEQGRHIFEKFYQVDTSHATRGNGLGLALVKRVVDITGSAITVQSTPGKGSTFAVRLGGVR